MTNGDTKEDFCGICLAVPLVLVGPGMSAAGARGRHRKTKKIVLWTGVATSVFAILLAMFYLIFKKKCKPCGD